MCISQHKKCFQTPEVEVAAKFGRGTINAVGNFNGLRTCTFLCGVIIYIINHTSLSNICVVPLSGLKMINILRDSPSKFRSNFNALCPFRFQFAETRETFGVWKKIYLRSATGTFRRSVYFFGFFRISRNTQLTNERICSQHAILFCYRKRHFNKLFRSSY